MSTQAQIDAVWQCLTRLEGEIEILHRMWKEILLLNTEMGLKRGLEERIRALEEMHKLK